MKRFEALIWSLAAFTYYCLLSGFNYTWAYASGDSGDWLASAKMWFVPQPYGSPLYITLAKLAGIGGDTAFNLTLLSIIPACIAVGAVFQTVKHLKGATAARLSALVMLGAAVFTSQAVVIEEYALAVMFLCLGILAYTYKRHNTAVALLGFGAAVHVIMFPLTIVFLLAHYKEWRYWFKKIPIFILTGVLPYGLIVWLMAADTPRWLAGSLSWQAFNSWLGSTETVGGLALVEAPMRTLKVAAFLLATYGLALIPAVKHAVQERSKPIIAALGMVVMVAVWLYWTNTDWTTWTFTIYAVPPIAILAGLAEYKHRFYVGIVAVMLIIVNSVGVNAARLSEQEPIAETFYNETMALPDGSYVLTAKGGFYTLGLYHAIGQGKDIIPVFLSEPNLSEDYGYQSWIAWAKQEYGLVGDDSIEQVRNAVAPVFYVDTLYMLDWSEIYELESHSQYYKEVTAVK